MFLECVGNIDRWIDYVQGSKTIYLKHTFQKQCGLSQYKIAGPNGAVLLSIPLVKESRKGWYDEVRISYTENWVQEHWRTLEAAYSNSPFFMYYDYRLKEIYAQKPEYLKDLNLSLFGFLSRSLKMESFGFEEKTKCKYSPAQELQTEAYPQVFEDRHGFTAHCCILDLLFNLGPEASEYLEKAHSRDA